jgi:uncharacterized protein (UPF0332 family)
MIANKFMEKAIRAAVSAQTLLDNGDMEGACDRAYYAMFNAARAALLKSNAQVPEEVARTHSGLISAFSLHLVKTNKIPVEYGRALNKVEDLRMIADYKGDPIEPDRAIWAVDQSKIFVKKMCATFMPDLDNNNSLKL